MDLFPIQRGGVTDAKVGDLPAEAAGALEATAGLYDRVGFAPPWICYIATRDGEAVGTCGFTSAPARGCVEIAYFTFPRFEGQGVSTAMAASLVSIAMKADQAVLVFARTLPERNASHRILEKLGFTCIGPVEVPEDGTVLEWHRLPDGVA